MTGAEPSDHLIFQGVDDSPWDAVVSIGGCSKTDESWGDDFARVGMAEAAREAYTQALKIDSNNESVRVKLARLDTSPTPAGPLSEIARLQSFDEAYAYGQAASGLGYHQLAIAVLLVATEIQPITANTWCTLGVAYRKAGELTNAYAALEKAEQLGGHNPAITVALAATHRAAGRYDEGIALYEEVLETDPDDPYALNGLGGIYSDLKQYGQAERCFLKAKRDPRGEKTATSELRKLEKRYRDDGRPDDARRIADLLAGIQRPASADDDVIYF